MFLGVVPLAVGGFGNFVMPLQIGAPDMAFQAQHDELLVYFVGGVIMLASFFMPNGAARSGWTSYPPLSIVELGGQTWWLFGMVCLITSSLLGSVNFIVTIVQLRAKGLSWMRLPFFVWAQFVTAFLLLLAFPPLEAAGVLQLMDRLAGTSFFLPSGLVVGGQQVNVAGGGNPLSGSTCSGSSRTPRSRPDSPGNGHCVGGHRQQHAQAVVGLPRARLLDRLSRLHVVHRVGAPHVHDRHGDGDELVLPGDDDDHLDPVGRHPDGAAAVVGASIRFTTPMLFALAFLPMFGIGGLTGLPLGLAPPTSTCTTPTT